MSNMERLNKIREMINCRLYRVADKNLDNMYEEYAHNKLKLSEQEEDYMFLLISRLSTVLYG